MSKDVGKERIIVKIQKLLNLADKNRNSSDNEAAMALLQAQKLMAEYDLQFEDLSDVSKEEMVQVGCTHTDNLGYRKALAMVIAKNFKVKTFFQGTRVMFYGYESDTELAKEAFEFAYRYIYRQGNRKCDEIRKQGYSARGVFNSYALGFIQGVRDAFDKQCVALMVVVPQEVSDSFSDMSKSWGSFRGGIRTDGYVYHDIYEQGRVEGQDKFSTKSLEEGLI